MKKILFLLPFLFVLYACNPENEATPLNIRDFKVALTAEMSAADVVKKFGEPTRDAGSGIHIYIYKLADETEIWIGCTDFVMYANHMSKDQQLIQSIL